MRIKVIAKKELEAELAMRLNVETNVAALVQQTGHSLETLMASIAVPVTGTSTNHRSDMRSTSGQSSSGRDVQRGQIRPGRRGQGRVVMLLPPMPRA